MVVLSLYRLSNTDLRNFNLKLNDFLETLATDRKKGTFIAGDTNLDLFKLLSYKY